MDMRPFLSLNSDDQNKTIAIVMYTQHTHNDVLLVWKYVDTVECCFKIPLSWTPSASN